MWTASLIQGFMMGASLIIAIGAQNAHIIKMGLQRQHVALSVGLCILCDVLLITLGVMGLGHFIQQHPLLLELTRWGGVIFLSWYALNALKSACATQHALHVTGTQMMSQTTAIKIVLAVSLFNPHVYLDTVVLLGVLGAQQKSPFLFNIGAITASVGWFSLLGWSAQKLAPYLNKPMVWRFIDAGVACMMLILTGILIFK